MKAREKTTCADLAAYSTLKKPTLNQRVVGSSPTASTNLPTTYKNYGPLCDTFVTLPQKFSFINRAPTEPARPGWVVVGRWDGSTLWHGAGGFYLDPFSASPQPLDEYEVGREMYLALKDHYAFSHVEMAEMLGVRQRTAEGMALGRVSKVNQRKLARLCTTINQP